MANPFDEVIGSGNGDEEKPQKKVSAASQKKSPKDQVHISFTIDKHMVERGIFSVIIIVLAFFAFFDPASSCNEDSNITGNVVAAGHQDEPAEINLRSEGEEEQTPESTTEAEETAEENDKEGSEQVEEKEEDNSDKPFKQNFDFKIVEIDFLRDADNDNRPSKMKSIKFLMSNRWKDFTPRIEVQWYDKASNEIIKEKKRAIVPLKTINKGITQKVTIDRFDSTFFDPTNDPETVVLHLYDAQTNLLMDTTTQVIS